MKWSDGHPFTAEDILYWWEHEAMPEPMLTLYFPGYMKVKDQRGNIAKLDDYTVKFTFPYPNGTFLTYLAFGSYLMLNSPRHYLEKFHPELGDPAVIKKRMRAKKMNNPVIMYKDLLKDVYNPEYPRLWPWLYRTFRKSAPHVFVRNPYYYVVDTEGNQLPYIDRVLFDIKSRDMVGISFANGEVSMQYRHTLYKNYTILMANRERHDYEVYHWLAGDGAVYTVFPNLNMRIDPDKPETALKARLLNDRRFRQALSLAINREAIIKAEYNGQTLPAQAAPGPGSFFYQPNLLNAFIDYDTVRANRLLDEIGLANRDGEGFRTYSDGSRMTFFLNFSQLTGAGPSQFIIDDWARVGIRSLMRERARRLFYTEQKALKHDLTVWPCEAFYPVIDPTIIVPKADGFYAQGFGKWYQDGGLDNNPLALRERGCIEPPADHPLRRAMEIFERVKAENEPLRQREILNDIFEIAEENLWCISISTPPPMLAVVKKGFRNVPKNVVAANVLTTPGNIWPETFFFENPVHMQDAAAQVKQEIITPVLPDEIQAQSGKRSTASGLLSRFIGFGFLAVVLFFVVLICLRHPFVIRRLVLLVPTLLVISLFTFFLIHFPPGDFLTSKIMELQEKGDGAAIEEIKNLKEIFKLDDPIIKRYARWLGLTWFLSFDAKDTGLLQGHMGISMENLRTVNDIVGDRILLTLLISLGTILFTWAVALPVGIYSAIRQYTPGDYFFTFIGFIGMCVPSFLLALLLMFFSSEFLGLPVSGLFSSEYGAQSYWNMAKFLDLLKHIWVPIVVLGVGGTAWMIRVMRANLLDELRKPYVVTARAKGVKPMKLLFKYPVRLALNPFISGIGVLFPQLVSGGAIVAMVLSLPTVGPLMLNSLMTEDMYLAGSLLMVLSVLGVLGTLVSDLLLLWLDPRIRFESSGR
jgi:ABC-type dipeptide/oligopeptide/nickel transport system permease component/ABC-type transport system substrate-binding protein